MAIKAEQRDLSNLSDADLELVIQGKYEDLSEAGAEAMANAPAIDLSVQKPSDSSVLDKMAAKKEELKSKGWANLTPAQRLGLMALATPGKMAEEVIGFTKGTPAMAMRAVPARLGQKLGELSRVPGAPQALGAAGGVIGEAAADLYEGKDVTYGKLAAAAGSGAVRGRHINGAAETAKEAIRQGSINTALDMGETAIDKGELKAPSAAAFTAGTVGVGAQRLLDKGKSAGKTAINKADEAKAYETVGASADAGYPIFPKQALPSKFERATNALVREDIGLPKTAKLTTGQFDRHIAKLTEPHRTAAKLSQEANSALVGMQEARAAARIKHNQYKASMGNRPDLLQEAELMDGLADSFESDLIAETRKLGKDALAEAIIENRTLLSKTYLARRATNLSTGVADAAVYGKELAKNPKKLTGEAKIIGDTYNANQLQEMKMKNMLSRPVTITQAILQGARHSAPGQALARNAPSFREYPDLSADAARFLINKEGRDDEEEKPASKPKTATERVKLFLFGK